MKQLLKGRTKKSVINSLANKTKEFMLSWPTDKDFSGAATSLARLQDTYQLSIEDMLEGRLANRTFRTELSAADCFEVGKQSYINGDSHLAVRWIKQALKKLKKEGSNPTIDKGEMTRYYNYAIQMENDEEDKMNSDKKLWESNVTHPEAQKSIQRYEDYLNFKVRTILYFN